MWKINKEVFFMQYLVEVGFGEERRNAFEWLEAHGYEKARSLSVEEYEYSVIVVADGCFFGGNVTCFAASAAVGIRPISWEDWRKTVKK